MIPLELRTVSLPHFAEKVAEILQEFHWTQTQLAEKAGVKQPYVSKWLSGEQVPELRILQLLNEKTGISFPWLIGGPETGTLRDAMEKEKSRGVTPARSQPPHTTEDDSDILTESYISLENLISLISECMKTHTMLQELMQKEGEKLTTLDSAIRRINRVTQETNPAEQQFDPQKLVAYIPRHRRRVAETSRQLKRKLNKEKLRKGPVAYGRPRPTAQ